MNSSNIEGGMEQLLSIFEEQDGVKVTTSLKFAEKLGFEHDTIMYLINKYRSPLEDLGTLTQTYKGTKVRGSRSTLFRYFTLNLAQTLFLLMNVRSTPVTTLLKLSFAQSYVSLNNVL